jgi:hypothetical protein
LAVVTPYSVVSLNFPPSLKGKTLDTRIYYAAAKLLFKDILRTAIKIASLFLGLSYADVGFQVKNIS